MLRHRPPQVRGEPPPRAQGNTDCMQERCNKPHMPPSPLVRRPSRPGARGACPAPGRGRHQPGAHTPDSGRRPRARAAPAGRAWRPASGQAGSCGRGRPRRRARAAGRPAAPGSRDRSPRSDGRSSRPTTCAGTPTRRRARCRRRRGNLLLARASNPASRRAAGVQAEGVFAGTHLQERRDGPPRRGGRAEDARSAPRAGRLSSVSPAGWVGWV